MFSPEDFEIPLEKKLKLRVVYDDIDKCNDVTALQENLKNCVEQMLKYQHLLTLTIQKQLETELLVVSDEVAKAFLQE
tara:strand:- start:258 stop:491 length:234 start_codon:yes stop_codon:yes gene_type:complete